MTSRLSLYLDTGHAHLASNMREELLRVYGSYKVDEYIRRYQLLGDVVLWHSSLYKESNVMYIEARKLFLDGYYRPCINSCCIAMEKLCRDLCLYLFSKYSQKWSWRTCLLKLVQRKTNIDNRIFGKLNKLRRIKRNIFLHGGGDATEDETLVVLQMCEIIIKGISSTDKWFIIQDGAHVLKPEYRPNET